MSTYVVYKRMYKIKEIYSNSLFDNAEVIDLTEINTKIIIINIGEKNILKRIYNNHIESILP